MPATIISIVIHSIIGFFIGLAILSIWYKIKGGSFWYTDYKKGGFTCPFCSRKKVFLPFFGKWKCLSCKVKFEWTDNLIRKSVEKEFINRHWN